MGRLIVYERDGQWFFSCPTCRWFEGAYSKASEARKDSKKHECRRVA